MPNKRQEIAFLKKLITLSPRTNIYKYEMKHVVELFKERKIPTVEKARKLIDLLGSKNKKTNIKGLERLAQYENKQKHLLEDYQQIQNNSILYKGNDKYYNKICSNQKRTHNRLWQHIS